MGLVERVTFHNPENGLCVLRVKARGHRELVTVAGHAAAISAGWADQKVIREIMVFLHQHGIGTARAARIFRTYGLDGAALA